MTDLKKITPTKLLWVDLEMTGLNPRTDHIIEVAAIMTDWNFTQLGMFHSGVKQDPQLIKDFAWLATQPDLQRQMLEVSAGGKDDVAVQNELEAFIGQFVKNDELVLLAGNSIHQDRAFIRAWWPDVDRHLHYRMLDVSAWKVVMQAKYGLEYTKKETHRALDDIQESIAELQFYLEQAHFIEK